MLPITRLSFLAFGFGLACWVVGLAGPLEAESTEIENSIAKIELLSAQVCESRQSLERSLRGGQDASKWASLQLELADQLENLVSATRKEGLIENSGDVKVPSCVFWDGYSSKVLSSDEGQKTVSSQWLGEVQRVALSQEAERLYRKVIAETEAEDELGAIAANNLGVLLVERGEWREAVEVLGRYQNIGSPAMRSRILLNFGGAFQAGEKNCEAIQKYAQGLELFPESPLLYERAYELVEGKGLSGCSSRAAQIVESLSRAGLGLRAERFLQKALSVEEWFGEAGYSECLIDSFVRHLTMFRKFDDSARYYWVGRLELLSEQLAGSARQKVDGISSAMRYAETPLSPVRWWGWSSTGETRRLFGEFLKALGDWFFRAGEFRYASAYYLFAWDHDRSFLPAARYLINALALSPVDLDPDGHILLSVSREVAHGDGEAGPDEIVGALVLAEEALAVRGESYAAQSVRRLARNVEGTSELISEKLSSSEEPTYEDFLLQRLAEITVERPYFESLGSAEGEVLQVAWVRKAPPVVPVALGEFRETQLSADELQVSAGVKEGLKAALRTHTGVRVYDSEFLEEGRCLEPGVCMRLYGFDDGNLFASFMARDVRFGVEVRGSFTSLPLREGAVSSCGRSSDGYVMCHVDLVVSLQLVNIETRSVVAEEIFAPFCIGAKADGFPRGIPMPSQSFVPCEGSRSLASFLEDAGSWVLGTIQEMNFSRPREEEQIVTFAAGGGESITPFREYSFGFETRLRNPETAEPLYDSFVEVARILVSSTVDGVSTGLLVKGDASSLSAGMVVMPVETRETAF